MGRLREPGEVAEAILFLVSDQAAFITDAILTFDGGSLTQQADTLEVRTDRDRPGN